MGRGIQGAQASELLKQRLEQLSSGTLSNYVTSNIGGALGLKALTIEGNLFNFGESWGRNLLRPKKSQTVSKSLIQQL